MMDAEELESEVVGTVQETQVKLGFSGGAESLYIPLDALADDREGAERLLGEFALRVRPRLGEVECGIARGRARIVVPEEGCRRVASLPVSPVLRAMVDAVNSRIPVAELRRRLESDFPDCVWRDAAGDGFDHVVTFDPLTDPNVYCVGTECGLLTYHRFSGRDFEAFGFSLDGLSTR